MPSQSAAASQSAASFAQTEQPLRVALLGYRSNPFSGGQGVYLKYLSAALTRLGHCVDVISGEPYPELEDGVRLIKLPGLNLFKDFAVPPLRPEYLNNFTDAFEWWSRITGGFPEPYTFGRRVTEWLLEHRANYDIVHDNQCLAWGMLKLQRCGIPLTTTIHHPITWDRRIALDAANSFTERLSILRWHHFLQMQTKVARQLKHVVTVSETSKQDIAKDFGIDPARITVVHNGVDSDEFRPLPDVAREPMQLITTASADQPLKGTQHFIEALERLTPKFPGLRVIFIGRPKPDGYTDKKIRSPALAPYVQVVPDATNEQLVKLYAKSSIAVVPSVYEGFGLPAVEAMACGLPVVATDGGALPEVIGDAGMIVPKKDPRALAAAIGELLRDANDRKYLGRRAREFVLERYQWETAAQHMTAHYQNVLA